MRDTLASEKISRAWGTAKSLQPDAVDRKGYKAEGTQSTDDDADYRNPVYIVRHQQKCVDEAPHQR